MWFFWWWTPSFWSQSCIPVFHTGTCLHEYVFCLIYLYFNQLFFSYLEEWILEWSQSNSNSSSLIFRALLTLFPPSSITIPPPKPTEQNNVPRKRSLKRRGDSFRVALGDIFFFEETLRRETDAHPLRYRLVKHSELGISFAIAIYMSFSFQEPFTVYEKQLFSYTRIIFILSLGIRFVVPLASSSRHLALEVLNLGQVSEDDPVRHSVNTLGGLLEGGIYVTGIYIVLTALGVDTSNAATGLGIGAFTIAFSLQKSLEALFATFALIVDKPFSIGDRVTLHDGEKGIIERIGLRTTDVRTVYDGELLIVPNMELANFRVRNHSKCNIRRFEIQVEIDFKQDCTKDKLIKFCQIMNESFASAPRIDHIDPCYLTGPGKNGGLVFELVAYVTGGETEFFREARHFGFLTLLDRMKNEIQVEFTIPTIRDSFN